MNSLVIDEEAIKARSVRCSDTHLFLTLFHGQEVSVPLWFYPALLKATPRQREEYVLTPLGIHWPQVDEDLSIQGIIEGRKSPRAIPPTQPIQQ